jgi:hypothetical protein
MLEAAGTVVLTLHSWAHDTVKHKRYVAGTRPELHKWDRGHAALHTTTWHETLLATGSDT